MEWKTPATPALLRWGALVLAGIVALLWLYIAEPGSRYDPRRILGAVMPPPKVIERIHTVEVPGPPVIRTIPKDRIVEYYNDLPTPQTLQDNAAVVIAVAEVPPSPEGGTAIAVLREGKDNVGVGTIEFQRKPEPFFKVRRDVGLRAGYGTGGIIGEVFVRPLRIGPVELEARVYGRGGQSDTDFGAAVMLEWRF